MKTISRAEQLLANTDAIDRSFRLLTSNFENELSVDYENSRLLSIESKRNISQLGSIFRQGIESELQALYRVEITFSLAYTYCRTHGILPDHALGKRLDVLFDYDFFDHYIKHDEKSDLQRKYESLYGRQVNLSRFITHSGATVQLMTLFRDLNSGYLDLVNSLFSGNFHQCVIQLYAERLKKFSANLGLLHYRILRFYLMDRALDKLLFAIRDRGGHDFRIHLAQLLCEKNIPSRLAIFKKLAILWEIVPEKTKIDRKIEREVPQMSTSSGGSSPPPPDSDGNPLTVIIDMLVWLFTGARLVCILLLILGVLATWTYMSTTQLHSTVEEARKEAEEAKGEAEYAKMKANVKEGELNHAKTVSSDLSSKVKDLSDKNESLAKELDTLKKSNSKKATGASTPQRVRTPQRRSPPARTSTPARRTTSPAVQPVVEPVKSSPSRLDTLAKQRSSESPFATNSRVTSHRVSGDTTTPSWSRESHSHSQQTNKIINELAY